MDEPTCSLSSGETEKLFATMDSLRRKGTSILYISHRLDEVYRMADRLTVMRDGENVGVLEKEQIQPQLVTSMMIGHELEKSEKKAVARDEGSYLEVKRYFAYQNLLKGISFKAYAGEILGIGGLVGSGRTELIKCIYGMLKPTAGEITLNGKKISRSVRKMCCLGLAWCRRTGEPRGIFRCCQSRRT